MTSKYPVLTAAQLLRVLKRHGFALVASRGSHQKWRNPASRRQVIVPYHQGRDLPRGTIKSIIDASGIPLSDWR